MNQNQRNSAIIFRKNRTLRERRFYLICCVIKRLQYYIYGCAFDALHLPAAGRSQAKAALAEFRFKISVVSLVVRGELGIQ